METTVLVIHIKQVLYFVSLVTNLLGLTIIVMALFTWNQEGAKEAFNIGGAMCLISLGLLCLLGSVRFVW